MAWYLEKRRHLESEVRKYSEPPSDALLPDLPPQAKCAYTHCSAVLTTHADLSPMRSHTRQGYGMGCCAFSDFVFALSAAMADQQQLNK